MSDPRPLPHVTVDEVELAADTATRVVAEYALWLGDDALILLQQLGGWIAHAPELEATTTPESRKATVSALSDSAASA